MFAARLRRVFAALALTAIVLPRPVAAANPPDPAPRKPHRIGLALGGGSARGLAHVGVLEWLREHRVPVDAVAGTSMGALIGGGFAIGMTDIEIRAITEGTGWDTVLTADAPFEDKTFRRKQDRRAFPAPLQFGLRRGLWLPRSLNAGQRIALLFDGLTLAYSALPSFDDLPTPFRCVAFDINRSESVVLDHGVLAEAMRATMALPAIFPPVTIDGRLLVDGGFVNNVPADVVRRMNVDVVIAVDVGRNPASDPDVTAFSMVSRAVEAVVAAGTKRSLESADVVITPELGGDLASIDWNKAAQWRERGYRAAEANASQLLRYAVGEAEYEAHEAARQARRRTDPIVPSAIVVTGVGRDEQEWIGKQMTTRAGQPVNRDQVARDLLLLSGTDRYDLLTYHLAEAPGGTQLVVTARPRANGPAFLTLGIELNNIDAANFATNVAGRTTVYDAVGRGSELRLDFVLGTRQGAAVELYRPFLAPWLFAAPRAQVGHSRRNLFAGDLQVGEYGVTRGGGGLDIGISAGRTAELRLGADATYASAGVLVGGPLLPEASGWERTASAQFVYDGQDNAVVPSKGMYARARARRFFDSPAATGQPSVLTGIDNPRRFYQAEFDTIGVHSLSPRNRVFVRLAGGTSFDAHPYFEDYSLGGPFRMSAFRNDELRGAHVGLASAGYLRRLPPLPAWVGGHAYIAAWVEYGSAFDTRASATWHTDIAAGLIVDSLLGPIFVGGGAGPDGHHRFYVSLGPLFR
jgi:NTE family protein